MTISKNSENLKNFPVLLSIKQASELIGNSESFWRKKIQEGKIAIVRIGSLIRIPLTEIQRMIDVSSNACQEEK